MSSSSNNNKRKAPAPGPKVSMAKKAGLHLPARAIKRQINDGEFTMRAGPEAAIYLAGQLEFIATAVVGAAADRATLCVNPKLQGVVTAQSIDALVRSDKSGSYAALIARPLFRSMATLDDEVVQQATKRQRRIAAAAAAPAAAAAE